MQQVLLGAALLAALCWNLAHASEIKDLQLDTGATGTRAEIGLAGQVDYKVISLSGPDRLVLDLSDAELARGFRAPAAVGIVKAIRTGHPEPGITRIVFDLAAPVVALKPRLEPSGSGTRLVLEWPGDNADEPSAVAASSELDKALQAPATPPAANEPEVDPSAASAAATARLIANMSAAQPQASAPQNPPPAASAGTTVATGVPTRIATGVPATMPNAAQADAESPAPTQPVPGKTLQQVMRGRGMRPLVVAIDPGHGGQDPGAIGMNGKREKDVTLAIGRELARQINATPGLKAYMTRDSDVFIPLNRRAQLARGAKADIFVSIHADAAENRSAAGASVYVLSLKGASSQRARWLADKENASDLIGGVSLQKGNVLANVLLDLTQSGHMKASEDAAGHVLDSLGRVGSARRVERANFAVLRTSDMPAMLVETAYISNPQEERLLTDPAHQRKVAAAVLDGINQYFTRQPPPGTLYAARAASSGGGAVGGGSP
ncbi:N-acetylmuramoyl-L-alanine amidase [Luteimonas sp. SX5]|uniref:N-acetylmuramoyl-L-alanine amidase n=1 Tax=Luteimonas galliterrae TaxID=2940486 RepID=A0ABT0MEJ6_9GAMM|nr:N-acetylmuramoyl-L-alanine amidase [Luteimonas galliterrae]MCL1633281.1 N-acetylmuramoyl-L-alanine amidase [Luteimonas galliterrae]